MIIDATTAAFSVLSGSLVGFSLGLIGGGGSILAVPLLAYLVGVTPAHAAIGTSALAVGANALFNLFEHARAGNVRWRCAGVFAASGILGALAGSTLGKMVDGDNLIGLFAIVMVATGIAMLRPRKGDGDATVRLTRDSAGRLLPRLIPIGLATGVLSGFFGIGGGFLIVPGLILATGMPMISAVASSLVGVSAFGFTTAANYAASGLIDWPVAGLFLVGGVLGGVAGGLASRNLAARRGALQKVFAIVIFVVAAYVGAKSLGYA
ncbi:sulfite exporter TauE/SafE family protein [Tepidamorphus sp. 3E244]|uniref:sulfite exporter TauE/SafE family protein n=1 Tax=Tepidamorphus sp. 3E244 TaxID=3385498 RepID=UPI0038FBFC28